RSFEVFPIARLGFEPSAKIAVEQSAAYRVQGLKSGNVRQRRMSAEALAEMGPRAVNAGAALREAKGDEDELVRRYAERALLGSGDEELKKVLAEVPNAK